MTLGFREFSRQIVHLLLGLLLTAIVYFFGKYNGLLATSAILALGFFLSFAISRKAGTRHFGKFVKHVERRHERKLPGKAALVFVLAIAVIIALFYAFSLEITLGALLVLSVGDSFNAIFGKAVGKTRLFGTQRTLEGTIAGIITSFLALLLLFAPLTAFAAALLGMLAEHLPFDDNFAIPIVAGVVLIIL